VNIAAGVRARLSYTRKLVRRLVLYPWAWLHRRFHPGLKVIGISGSAGKTTTKDVCDAMLSSFGPTVSSFRSHNHRIAVAETLLRATRKHLFCVLELSEHRPGVLDLPISIARPDVGVLTLLGRDHYSAFKSEDAIAAELSKLIHRLTPDGVAVLNIDDPRIREIGESSGRPVIWVGRHADATLRLLQAESHWPQSLRIKLHYGGEEFPVETRLHGEHLALPVLAALGVAVALGIPLESAIAAIREVEPVEGRMQLVEVQGVYFLRDDWKAPHWSLDLPFKFMAEANAARKVVVVGSVSDSKLSPSKRYPRIAAQVREFADQAIFVGPHSKKALRAQESADDGFIQAFDDLAEASSYLNATLTKGDLVLLKGTNLQDHLVRLVHNYSSPISCWRESCSIQEFCDQCGELYEPAAPSPSARFEVTDVEAGRGQRYQWRPAEKGTMLIVGLGNPQAKYSDTPHNLGFVAVDALASRFGAAWQKACGGVFCEIEADGVSVVLFKAGSAMNLTGEKLKLFLENCEKAIGGCLIVHDDLDLPIGKCRFKLGGGHGGHKGVYSVIDALGYESIVRLKIGGRPPKEDKRARDLVLRKFSKQDKTLVARGVSTAVDELVAYLREPSEILSISLVQR